MLRTLALWALAVFFVLAGLNHFLNPTAYLGMMPSYIPWHWELIVISGAAEMLGGAGVLIPRFRRLAGWGLIALLIAVFPANVQVALHGQKGLNIQPWIPWARLPLQAVLIAWVCWAALSASKKNGPQPSPGGIP